MKGVEVYDTVPGMPGGVIKRTVREVGGGTREKYSVKNSLERVIAMHEDVSAELVKQGMAVFQRADFRMNAAQQRTILKLREELADAIKQGDPKWITYRQEKLDDYLFNRTKVTWSQADIDFHISLFREDGNEFFVEIDGDGDRGVEVLKKSLTG